MSEDFDTVATTRWSKATTTRCERLDDSSRAALLDLVAPLRLSDNQMRDILDLLEDTAARRGVSVATVLADDEVRALGRRAMARSEKVKALKMCLRRLRYPQLSAAVARIDELRGALGLPRGVTLEVPENLEGDEVVITLRATSVRSLRSRSEQVAACLGRGEVESIFAILEEAAE